jgi:stalled ribosome rescue protein Dom34
MVHDNILSEHDKLMNRLNEINSLLTKSVGTNRDDYDTIINCWVINPNKKYTDKLLNKLKDDDLKTIYVVLKELKLLNYDKFRDLIIPNKVIRSKLNEIMEFDLL